MSPQDPAPHSAPRVLGGRYEIHRTLARGGMADVYLARDRSLDRPVAVKVLFNEFSTDPSFVERFRREAQAAAGLAHPNIVAVYDWGAEDGTYFIVMEYVDGTSLADVIRDDGALAPRRAAEIVDNVAAALGFAHAKGVIHRDVKPGNILISNDGVAKVTDFGIARAISSPAEDLTQAGSVMGTATYFSPEQAQGFPVEGSSDLYSLGVVLFEMLCGRPPFTGDTPVAIAYRHVQEAAPRPSALMGDIPVGLEAIVMRLLAKNPDNRYRSGEDLRADLRRWTRGELTMAERAASGRDVPVAGEATRVAVPPVAVAAPAPDDLDDDFDDAPRRRTGLFATIFVVLVLILAGLSFWLWQSLSHDSPAIETAEVPGVVNLGVDEARDVLTKAHFAVEVQEEPSDAYPADTVFDQSPKAGQLLELGKTVVISVSTGSQQLDVPNVAGLSRADAEKLLRERGFTKVRVVETPSDTVDAGTAVGTTPAFGQSAAATAEIVLTVSTGRPTVPIPPVAGKNLSAARSALTAAGFKIGEVIEQNSDTVAKDLVIGTQPDGSAPANSVINILRSIGNGQVTVPSVVGQPEAAATSTLEGRNFQVTVRTKSVPAGDSDVGRVLSQAPAAGTEVAPRSGVTITVGVASAATTTAPPPPPTSTTTTGT